MLDELFRLEKQPYTENDAEWDGFVAAHPQGSLLQTTQWAQLKNHFGWESHRVWLRQQDRLVAGAQVLFRSLALGMARIAYIPHGPLVDWENQEQVEILFNQIDLAAYDYRAGLLKMEPLLWQREMPQSQWESLCQRHEYNPHTDTIQPPRTLLVDLRPPEEDILMAMKQKTRYNIRLSRRKGVEVRQGTMEDIPVFNGLIQVTAQRDDFGVHDPAYYKTAFEVFSPDNVAMFIAEYEGRPLAAIMVFAVGDTAAYLYGASSNEERQRMPTYAVQWEAMRWAKARGCTEYDLWGVPDYPKEELEDHFTDRSDGLWGVYRFKRGFGGELHRTVGAADRVYNKLLYRLYRWRRGGWE